MSDSSVKNTPTPVRFDDEEDIFLDNLKADTGFSKSEIVRRACRYAFPKFISGEVNIMGLVKTKSQLTFSIGKVES